MSEQVTAAPDAGAVIDTTPPAVGGAQAETPVVETKDERPFAERLDDTLDAAWEKANVNGNDRAPDGKFAGKDGKAAEQAPADAKPDSAAQKTEAEPATPAIEPPNSWTAEAKAHWAKLPPETQSYIAQRESEAHKAITSYGERVKTYEPFEQIITQHKDDFARRGMGPAQAFAFLLNAQKQLDANPVQGLVDIGLTYGIDLRPLLSGQQGQLPASDPRVGQVEQRLNHLQQTLQQQQQQAEQAAQAEAEATLKEFSKDKPYYQDVRGMMATFLQSGHAQTLQEAYDMAVNASPSTRARIQADQRAADDKKRQDEAAKAAEEAKKKAADAQKSAKVNVRGSSAHPNPKTMDDTLRSIADRAYG